MTIDAKITNLNSQDTSTFYTHLYVKDKVQHEFNSIKIGTSENIDGHFKFIPSKRNSDFFQAGKIYKVTLTYILRYRLLVFKMHRTVHETFNFTLSEKELNDINKDQSDENDFYQGTDINLIP